MITERDNKLISYFEEYYYATIKILEKIYFKGSSYSYNICRKRLGELIRLDYIRSIRDAETNKFIYIFKDKNNKINPPSRHRMILLEFLAELCAAGYDVETFKVEKRWLDGKIKSDAFTIFTINDRRYHFFVEVQISNNPHNLEKYDTLFESGEVQKCLGKDFFPRVIHITDRKHGNIVLKHTNVLNINTNIDAISSILL